MNLRFEFADKTKLEEILPALFGILYSNMSRTVPMNDYAAEYTEWQNNVYPALQKPQRQLVLMYDGDILIGFFQYYVNSGTFMMEEIQIAEKYQGTGVFSAFFSWLISLLPPEIQTAEAYTHKDNTRSAQILSHLALEKSAEADNGIFYHYKDRKSVV